MKFGVLKSIGHNIADSLASGLGLMIGTYGTDIFTEAAQSPEGFIAIDFLNGEITGARPSPKLAHAISRYCKYLDAFCEKHAAERSAFSVLQARYGTDPIEGRHYTVTVENLQGRRSEDIYRGVGGVRIRGAYRRSA